MSGKAWSHYIELHPETYEPLTKKPVRLSDVKRTKGKVWGVLAR